MVDGNFEIRPAQMLQNHFKLFDYFTIIDGNFEICAAQMLQIAPNSLIVLPLYCIVSITDISQIITRLKTLKIYVQLWIMS